MRWFPGVSGRIDDDALADAARRLGQQLAVRERRRRIDVPLVGQRHALRILGRRAVQHELAAGLVDVEPGNRHAVLVAQRHAAEPSRVSTGASPGVVST